MPSVAVTDQCNLFSLVKFYKYSQAAGLKPIMGADVYIENDTNKSSPYRLTLLVKNKSGYIALSELLSRSYQEGQSNGLPILKKSWVEDNCQNLIALSGAMDGDIGQYILANNFKEAENCANYWNKLFPGSFYIELQRIKKLNEEFYIGEAVKIASACSIPVVATNDVRFENKEDFNAHDVRVCINLKTQQSNQSVKRNYTKEQYFKTEREMIALFSDIPSAIENTVEIAKRCTLDIVLGQFFLPDFPVPEGTTLAELFVEESKKGLVARLAQYAPIGEGTLEERTKVYEDRLDFELGVINQMGFPGYFMIVADFIQWAKNNQIPVGPGRGSGAGSLVAYSLKITDLDPIEFDLLFERFLNPERVSMPDFDIDFCMDRRDEVIDYVSRHYGKDKVSQIITYGSMSARAVIADVGRTLGHPYGFHHGLSKLIPNELGIDLKKAINDSPELAARYRNEEDVKNLIDVALALEGTKRNAGKHAGGVVIAPTKLSDFSPLYCDENGNNLVTQYDKDDVESVGLVKFDFLGLRTLTIIDWALQSINAEKVKNGEALVDITQIPKNDKASFDLLLKAQTTAVFQLESRGMKELIKKLKPDCFDDIIALVALFRPGPLEAGMVDDYIRVKHGAKAEYSHPLLVPILKPTNGVILYQEQVMEIARKLAGYSLGGADMLRRAMGKKKPEEMAKQRAVFTDGSVNNGIDEKIATGVFDLMEKFAGYGFNKSHSAAYALIAYQTAWLKAHYPADFMAAVLSSDMDNTDKVVIFLEECKEMGLEIINPDINISNYKFTVSNGKIIFGLGAIKGMGEAAIDDLIKQRDNKKFDNLYDLCRRSELRKVNKKVLGSLVKVGAFDSFHENRLAHFLEISRVMKVSDQFKKMDKIGQSDLLSFFDDEEESNGDEELNYTELLEYWTETERLAFEKETVGLYLSGHPIDQYCSAIKEAGAVRISNIEKEIQRKNNQENFKVAGLILAINVKITKKGDAMANVLLDDGSGRVEVTFFSEAYNTYKDILKPDTVIFISGLLKENSYSGNVSISVNVANTMDSLINNITKALKIRWDSKVRSEKPIDFIKQLQLIIEPYKSGNCPVIIEYCNESAKTDLLLGSEWNVNFSDGLINLLNKELGTENIKILR